MCTRLYVVMLGIATVAACGDNIHMGSSNDGGAEDASDIDAPGVTADADPCPSDTVRTIRPGNPGPNASDYPATGWWSDDTRANGSVVVDDSLGMPAGFGCRSAKLTTGASTGSPSADKAQLMNFEKAGVTLASITTVSYWSYRSSASTGGPAIALALNVSVTGSTVPGGYANLVFEPYHQSGGNAGVQVDTWQQWDATATTPGDGRWWTSKIPNGPGSQANPQTWAAFQALYSDAKIHGYGFNLGSVNPNMIVGGDGLVFGTTTTNF